MKEKNKKKKKRPRQLRPRLFFCMYHVLLEVIYYLVKQQFSCCLLGIKGTVIPFTHTCTHP